METDLILLKRKTEKILAEKPWPILLSEEEQNKTAKELLLLACHAPYHQACNDVHKKELKSSLPYRFYILSTEKCRETAKFFSENNINSGKVNNLLFAADLLFIITWLPEPSDKNTTESEFPFDGNLKNMEHIAATSAAIQNVLIGATSRNIPNYWSTGGKLRSDELKKNLNIPLDEIVAGCVFLFPKEILNDDFKILPGGLRNKGKEQDSWSKWV